MQYNDSRAPALSCGRSANVVPLENNKRQTDSCRSTYTAARGAADGLSEEIRLSNVQYLSHSPPSPPRKVKKYPTTVCVRHPAWLRRSRRRFLPAIFAVRWREMAIRYFTTSMPKAVLNFKVSDSPKCTWKLINDITSTNKKNDVEIKSIMVNNKIISTPEDPIRVLNIFNEFFVTVGK